MEMQRLKLGELRLDWRWPLAIALGLMGLFPGELQAGKPGPPPQAAPEPPPSAPPVNSPVPSPPPMLSPGEILQRGGVGHIEISLSDRRLTLYQGETSLRTYPIAIGREGWPTPVGQFQVTQMIMYPDWMHPFSGMVIPGGHPENPLGDRWIGFWTDGSNWIGIHGTPDPSSIGQAASHGCIRLQDHHVREVFQLIQLGTLVVVTP
jgi:lipoprotein-anchoring transpeptidase ErfK/SrfK